MHNHLDKLTDEELVIGAVYDNSSCLGELYRRYYHKVLHKCISFVKDESVAFDLTQDVLIKAFFHLRTYRQEAGFSTWLYAITANHCRVYLRDRRHNDSVALEEGKNVTTNETEDEEELNIGILEGKLYTFLDQLEADDKEMLLMKYCQNISIQELQEIFQLSASAVKMRLSRAKKKLALLFYQAHNGKVDKEKK